MSERSIAEIIGCSTCRGTGHAGDPYPDCRNCNGRGCMSCVLRHQHGDCEDDCPECCTCLECAGTTPGGTVDDLLFWLNAQGRTAQVRGCFAGAYRQVRVTEPGDDPGTYMPFSAAHHGPTLLAALEKAVRAVDLKSSLASGSPEAEVEAAPSPAAPTSQSGSL